MRMGQEGVSPSGLIWPATQLACHILKKTKNKNKKQKGTLSRVQAKQLQGPLAPQARLCAQRSLTSAHSPPPVVHLRCEVG